MRPKRRLALAVLLAAGGVAVLSFPFRATWWGGFILAIAEAGVVGGLADWFAVTALFRRPLGLPIPHTAIVATQKDRIGRVLGNFVQNHFLSRDVVAAELRALRLSERAARWVSDPQNSSRVAKQLVTGLAKTIEALPEDDIRELIHQSAVARLQSARVAPVLANVLAVVTTDNRHQQLLNEVITLMSRAIQDNRDVIRAKIRAESPWWVPGILDQVIYQKILIAIENLLLDVRADPSHPMRRKFDTALENFIEGLKHSPDVIARVEAVKAQVLAHPLVDELAASLWDAVRRAAARYRPRPDGRPPDALERGIAAAGESLLTNEALLRDLDDFIIDLVSSVAERHRQAVAEGIARVVRAWDPEVAVQRLELAVGSDLQFIRINGTL
ncbi:MAG: DUF445 domain-containing protein, partial [Gemmatimonadales bacterium]